MFEMGKCINNSLSRFPLAYYSVTFSLLNPLLHYTDPTSKDYWTTAFYNNIQNPYTYRFKSSYMRYLKRPQNFLISCYISSSIIYHHF